jgi:hypothetical protein
MVHRFFTILPLVFLCACASSRPSLQRSASSEPLPPQIKPLTVEQEEQVRASGVR